VCATHIIFDASLELQQVCEVVFRCDEVHLRARRNKANNSNDDTESPVSQNELCQQRHHHNNKRQCVQSVVSDRHNVSTHKRHGQSTHKSATHCAHIQCATMCT